MLDGNDLWELAERHAALTPALARLGAVQVPLSARYAGDPT